MPGQVKTSQAKTFQGTATVWGGMALHAFWNSPNSSRGYWSAGLLGAAVDAVWRMHTSTPKVNSSLRSKHWARVDAHVMELGTYIGFFKEGHSAAGGTGSPDSLISTAVISNFFFFFLPLNAPCYSA